MKRLAGKIAIVTGSSSGIGKAIALTFGKEGAAVVIAARRKDLCEKTVAQIRKEGGDAMAIQTDVTDEAQVERLITETVKRSEEHTSELQSPCNLVCRLLLEKK